MMGRSIETDDFVISADLNCVIALKEWTNEKAQNCIRCGKCVEVCPSHLSPVLIKDSLNNKNNLKELDPNKCIECGLCSYTCPAKINIRECVKKAKQVLDEERGE